MIQSSKYSFQDTLHYWLKTNRQVFFTHKLDSDYAPSLHSLLSELHRYYGLLPPRFHCHFLQRTSFHQENSRSLSNAALGFLCSAIPSCTYHLRFLLCAVCCQYEMVSNSAVPHTPIRLDSCSADLQMMNYISASITPFGCDSLSGTPELRHVHSEVRQFIVNILTIVIL